MEWEGPGIIALEANKRGIEVDVRRLDREDEIPETYKVDGMMVMGDPFGSYEEDWYPFLDKECELLAAVARRGEPLRGRTVGYGYSGFASAEFQWTINWVVTV